MASLSDVTHRLSTCMAGLTASQAKRIAAVELAEQIHEAALELGAEGTAADVQKVIDDLQTLGQTLDQAKTTATTLTAQVAAIGHGKLSRTRGGTGNQPANIPAGTTRPSKQPDPEAAPRGQPEDALGHAATQAAINQQNRAARVLARAGYEIEQLPPRSDQKSPDFRIEGRLFDCYAPQGTTSMENIRSKLRKKINSGQARRFVVVLDQNGFSAADLRGFFARKAPSTLEEVLVLDGDTIERIWP